MRPFRRLEQITSRSSEAQWLDAKRAWAWCSVLAVMSAVFIFGTLALSRGGVDAFGKPLGTDFVSFWTASQFALAGHPASVYQPATHIAAERALFPHAIPAYAAFFYPPTFLLLCLPLALLPYLASLALWLAAGLALLVAALRRLLPQNWALLPMLAFPAVLDTLGHGQNAFITASCFAWSAVLRRRHPFAAGLCLGCLVIKPHLLVAAPIALLAGRQWRMIAGGLVSGTAIILLSWAIFGEAAWLGFWQLSPLARATLEDGIVEPWKMQSVFTAIRLVHGSIATAYALQAVVAITTLCLLARIAWRRPSPEAEGAMLPLATMLCTPFLLDYDLTCLAVPLAWMAASAQRGTWRQWEKTTLLAAFVLPLVARPLAMHTSLTIAPAVIAAVFCLTSNRALQPDRAHDQSRIGDRNPTPL